MNLKSKKGFSLVELIIVIAILGIIALIAVPNLTGIQKRSQVNADIRTAEALAKALTICVTEDRDVSATVSSTKKLNDKLASTWYNLNTIQETIFTGTAEVKFTEYIDDLKTTVPASAKKFGGTDGAYYVRYVTQNEDGDLLETPKVVVVIHQGLESGDHPATIDALEIDTLPYNAEFPAKPAMIACIQGLDVTIDSIAEYDLQ